MYEVPAPQMNVTSATPASPPAAQNRVLEWENAVLAVFASPSPAPTTIHLLEVDDGGDTPIDMEKNRRITKKISLEQRKRRARAPFKRRADTAHEQPDGHTITGPPNSICIERSEPTTADDQVSLRSAAHSRSLFKPSNNRDLTTDSGQLSTSAISARDRFST